MKAFTVICSLILSSLVIAPPMLAQTPAGVRLESGIAKEDVDGDLKSAIDIYQKIAADASAPRDVRSKALLRLAGCYEKLGRQATQLYEQVVRDFADQPAATQARNRLAAMRLGASSAPATMTQRKIEVPGAAGPPITDGQRAVYHDAATGALVISDLSGKDKRVILKPKQGGDFHYWPSRDLSVIVLPREDPGHPLALIKTDGTGYREIGLTGAGVSPGPPAWSWDNRYVLFYSAIADGTNLLLRITAADGSTQEMLRRNTPIRAASFSPDGRFIAYSEGALSSVSTFVMPSQGGDPQLISANATLIDWTRDGRYLAVASPHSGATALQLLPVKDGKPAGDPVFVRYGSFIGGQTTASGSLLYLSFPDAGALRREWIADLDPEGHPGNWKNLDPGSSGQLAPVPTWSPDSGQIVWTVQRADTGQVGFVGRVRNLATGKERDLFRGTGLTVCIWAASHPNLFCSEAAGDGTTTSIFSVAVDSGRTEQIGAVRGAGLLRGVALPNDQALYFQRQSTGEFTRWDIGTGQETLLDHTSNIIDLEVDASPDGGWLKRFNRGNIEIRPMAGGAWTPLLPLRAGGQSGFSPDGKWIFYHDKDVAGAGPVGKDGLYRIATAGGAPERLGDFPVSNVHGTLRISPDGRGIIVLAGAAGNVAPETWLLENFEPRQQAAK
jgi:Tol biopolymer transport system component